MTFLCIIGAGALMLFLRKIGFFLISSKCLCLLSFVIFVPSFGFGMSNTNIYESFIRCHIEGGNIPIRATTIEFFDTGDVTYLKVTKHFWEKEKKSTSKVIQIPINEYQKLWDWIDGKRIWDLDDVTFRAEDAVTYTFEIKKEARKKTIRAMSLGTLPNKKYKYFYSLLREIQKKYLSE